MSFQLQEWERGMSSMLLGSRRPAALPAPAGWPCLPGHLAPEVHVGIFGQGADAASLERAGGAVGPSGRCCRSFLCSCRQCRAMGMGTRPWFGCRSLDLPQWPLHAHANPVVRLVEAEDLICKSPRHFTVPFQWCCAPSPAPTRRWLARARLGWMEIKG